MTAKSSQDHAQKKSRKRGTLSVTEILNDVLEPVLARKTGMRIDLVQGWAELVGADYANSTRPEKINWPKRKHEDDPFEPGILIVACEPSAALFFQHDQAQIIERVNLYFGFEAIKRIKILQKPVIKVKSASHAPPKQISRDDKNRLTSLLEKIDDPDIKATLSTLGEGVFSKKTTE